jgi:hypothetical protein
LAVAHAEMAEMPKFDYFLPSATPAEDLRRMQAILEVEEMRPARQPAFVRVGDRRRKG